MDLIPNALVLRLPVGQTRRALIDGRVRRNAGVQLVERAFTKEHDELGGRKLERAPQQVKVQEAASVRKMAPRSNYNNVETGGLPAKYVKTVAHFVELSAQLAP